MIATVDAPTLPRNDLGGEPLTGPRLHLRPVMKQDTAEIYRRSLDLGARGRFFPLNVRPEVAVEKTYAEGLWGDTVGLMLMVQNSDDAIVGYVVFERQASDLDEVIIGYQTYPEYRGQGYVSEGLRLFTEYLFAQRRDMNRAVLQIHVDNEKSIRVAERCGFTREGVSRESWFNRGRWNDVYIYSLLRRELADGRPPELRK